MANDYTSSSDVFAQMTDSTGYQASTDFLPVMDGLVTVASRLIDREVGRRDGFFYPTTDTVTYYYDGSGDYEQSIDEFVSVSSVSVAEQGGVASTSYTDWTEDTDYLTLPYNASNDGRPINRLQLLDYNRTKSAWAGYQKAVKVQGVAGYASSPPDIVVQACKMQALRYFMRAKQGYQDTGANVEIGQLVFQGKMELDEDVRALLMPLKLELTNG